MRSGIAFPHRSPHEGVHLQPLLRRLHDVLAAQPRRARVAVLAGFRRPVRGAWNVQAFAGLDQGDARLLRRRLTRRSRYQQVNAHGPRWGDLYEATLADAEVSRFGHVALNEAGEPHADPEGPVLWLPTRLAAFTDQALALAANGVPVLVKAPPHERHALAAARNVTVAPPEESPYRLLHGCRGVLADAGSLALEAYCAGLPVALARPEAKPEGLHAELADRVPAFSATDPALLEWAHAPPPPTDTAWARDLLYAPDPRRNDAFAARLRERATGAA